MSNLDKLSIIVRVKSRFFPEEASYYQNLYRMFTSGLFTYDSVLAEVKNG